MPLVPLKLPNGQTIWHLAGTQGEVLLMYLEIMVHRVYSRHGIEIGDGSVVVDVGANIGMFTTALLASHQRLRVFCFEPVPEIRECLEKNVGAAKQGGDSKIAIIPCALGARDGSAAMTFLPGCPANSTLYPDLKRDELYGIANAHPDELKPRIRAEIERRLEKQDRIECPMARLSSLIRSERLERMDLLKIDVEGAELEVLQGIDDDHWPLIRQLAMEFACWNKKHLPALEEELRERGFTHFSLEVLEAYRGGGAELTNANPCMVYARR